MRDGAAALIGEGAPSPRPRRSRAFGILWGFDAAIAAVVLFFFLLGLSDGSVSSFNIGIWLLFLLGVGGVVGGSFHLSSRGLRRPALALALVLAVPGLLYALFLLVVLIGRPRWN